MPSLSVTRGPTMGAVFRFDQGTCVGRGTSADIALGDASVSRRHATLAKENGIWGVTDLESANGTFVNGRKITQRTAITHGDTVRFGAVVTTFEDKALVPSPTGPVPAPPARDPESSIILRVPPEAADLADPTGGYTLFGGGQRSRVLDSLAKISALVFDEKAMLKFVVDELLKGLPQAQRAFVMLYDPATKTFVPATSRTDAGDTGPVIASQTLMHEVLESKEAVLFTNAPNDKKFSDAASIHALKMTSAVCAPILFQQEVFGVVQVDCSRAGEMFTRSDVALTLAVALEVGMALAYGRLHAKLVEKEIVERDMALARKVQHHFLPAGTPDVPGYGFAVEYRPALAVGGDLYDFVPLADGQLALAVGDVSGKGVSAALFAAKVMSDLRHLATGEATASAILKKMNRALSGGDEGMFVTLGLAIINPKNGRLIVASAGHPLPLVRDGTGKVMEIGQIGDKPLGLDDQAEFSQHEYEIDPGDSVVMFTDGVIEAISPQNQLFGDERLHVAVSRTTGGAKALIEAISGDVKTFAGTHPQSDDVTILGFERK